MNAANTAVTPLPSVLAALDEATCTLLARADVPARGASLTRPPPALDARVSAHLGALHQQGIYTHQAEAIERFLAGEDVCLATATASGKSLPFMTCAADLLVRDPSARVLVLYPARALIRDQDARWRAFLAPLGLSAAVIDGGVAVDQRAALTRKHRVILMTPDVAHAWLLGRCDDRAVQQLLASLRLLVLDETHVYEGVFGTNMAYLLRRLRSATPRHRLVASTATLGDAQDFLRRLTGRTVHVVGPDRDGSASAARSILHVAPMQSGFTGLARLVAALARSGRRFLAFADSRRMVEQLVAAARRKSFALDDDDSADATPTTHPDNGVLPYRAGLESDDRARIQEALARGTLAGVVSTSAMELGIDIGEIDVVALLGVPPTTKSFRQRMGRAGRRSASVCVLVDDDGRLGDAPTALADYLARPMEPSWLYLDNRYLQYANVLCAAAETRPLGTRADDPAFADLPATFRDLLANELDPQAAIADDLYPLKQRGSASPHHEFPMRTGVERNFQIVTSTGGALGTVSFSQLLREAYPGAVYYYMAQPYRVWNLDVHNGRVGAARDKFFSTRPIRQSMVFPNFGGIYQLRGAGRGFVAEVPVQVSERVLGFVEQRGTKRIEHRYGQGSPYAQRELGRFFATTGVCWYFSDRTTSTEAVGAAVLRAFCETFGVHDGDVGVGMFHARQSPLGAQVCQGLCLFDANHGSLRLTQQLVSRFGEVLAQAITTADGEGKDDLVAALQQLAVEVSASEPRITPSSPDAPVLTSDEEWVEVIVAGERAVLQHGDGARDVTILGFRYTPRGPMYDLAPERADVRWSVAATAVQAIHGVTRTQRVNLVTGDVEA